MVRLTGFETGHT